MLQQKHRSKEVWFTFNFHPVLNKWLVQVRMIWNKTGFKTFWVLSDWAVRTQPLFTNYCNLLVFHFPSVSASQTHTDTCAHAHTHTHVIAFLSVSLSLSHGSSSTVWRDSWVAARTLQETEVCLKQRFNQSTYMVEPREYTIHTHCTHPRSLPSPHSKNSLDHTGWKHDKQHITPDTGVPSDTSVSIILGKRQNSQSKDRRLTPQLIHNASDRLTSVRWCVYSPSALSWPWCLSASDVQGAVWPACSVCSDSIWTPPPVGHREITQIHVTEKCLSQTGYFIKLHNKPHGAEVRVDCFYPQFITGEPYVDIWGLLFMM